METVQAPPHNLADRTFAFASAVRTFVRRLPKMGDMFEDGKQVIRSSGSVGANYIEASEAFSSRDRMFRFQIVRKEAKETAYWLRLIHVRLNGVMQHECEVLIDESNQLVRIFSSILAKVG